MKNTTKYLLISSIVLVIQALIIGIVFIPNLFCGFDNSCKEIWKGWTTIIYLLPIVGSAIIYTISKKWKIAISYLLILYFIDFFVKILFSILNNFR